MQGWRKGYSHLATHRKAVLLFKNCRFYWGVIDNFSASIDVSSVLDHWSSKKYAFQYDISYNMPNIHCNFRLRNYIELDMCGIASCQQDSPNSLEWKCAFAAIRVIFIAECCMTRAMLFCKHYYVPSWQATILKAKRFISQYFWPPGS